MNPYCSDPVEAVPERQQSLFCVAPAGEGRAVNPLTAGFSMIIDSAHEVVALPHPSSAFGALRGSARALSGLVGLCLLLAFACLCPSATAAEDAYDNVVILLDSSGSMAERMPGTRLPKMTAAKTALKEVLQRLPPSTHVGVLIFGENANQPEDWIYPLGPRDEKRLISAIDRVRTGHGTPLGAFIKRAADRLLEKRAQQLGYGTFRLLIVSDGEAQDRELVERYTPEVMARGITVDVIGVAMARQHTLATRVHSYRAADNPESLKRALGEVLAEVGGSVTDMAGADAFDLIAPIPLELAAAAIQKLAVTANQPIGERAPLTQPASAMAPATPTSPAQAAPAPVAGSPAPPTPSSAPTPQTRSRVLFLVPGVFCLGAVVLIPVIILLAIRNFSRRR